MSTRLHEWLYSNTSEVWFCKRCHRWDRSGSDVGDSEPCPQPISVSATTTTAITATISAIPAAMFST